MLQDNHEDQPQACCGHPQGMQGYENGDSMPQRGAHFWVERLECTCMHAFGSTWIAPLHCLEEQRSCSQLCAATALAVVPYTI